MDPALSTGLALAVVVITLVALVSIGWLRRTRAAQKARRTWEAAIEARFREHGGHSGRLMLLERVLDAHITAHQFDVQKTVARPRPTDAQLAAARPGATAAALEAAQLSEPPVDSDGDRGGINPGDPIPDSADSKAALRARLEAEADAREAARDAQEPSPSTEPGSDRRPVPMDQQTERAVEARAVARLRELEAAACNDVDEPPGEDEQTRIYDGAKALRHTLLGGVVAPHPEWLSGVKPERPTSSATRTADAFRRKQHGSSPTLISAGITRPESAPDGAAPGLTTPPDAPANDAGAP